MRVALLGSGKMGAAIASRLAAAGFDLVLWNRTPERARGLGVLVAAEHAGLQREAAFGLLQRTVPYLEARRRSYIDRQHSPALFFLRDLVKDLDLALQTFHAGGASTPTLALARETNASAVPEHGEEELSAVIERFS